MNSSKSSFTHVVLIGLVAFNIIGIGLSEVQRRALVANAMADNAETKKALNVVEKRLSLIEVQNRSLWQELGATAHRRDRKFVAALFGAGETVAIRFDDSIAGLPQWDAAKACAVDGSGAYLGAFIPGQTYTVAFDPASRNWTATGPSQRQRYNATTRTCFSQTATYNQAQLSEEVLPESGRAVIWGAIFDLKSTSLEHNGRKVGEVIGLY